MAGYASQTTMAAPVQDELSMRVRELLAAGGDDRLVLDARGVNKYQTPALPHPDAIHRSSCTSSCVTDYSFEKAKEVVAELEKQPERYPEMLADIQSRLFKVLNLDKSTTSSIVCPSGSDAEYIPLLVALLRLLEKPQGAWGSGVLSIVTGAGEVGSGTALAAQGKHFSNFSPSEKVKIKTGTDVFNLPEGFPGVDIVEVTMRDKDANLKSQEDLDAEVTSVAQMALQEQDYKVVVVHMVTGSKTGYLIPSVNVLQDLSAKFGKQVVPVVDACQGRMQENGLRSLVEDGFMVLTTGSKFYGGPPFSGAILFKTNYTEEIEASAALTPELLGDFHLFFGDLHLSDNLPKLKETVRASAKGLEEHNRGMLVRWAVAMNEMETFHAIPLERREAIMKLWLEKVRAHLTDDIKSPLIGLQPLERYAEEEGAARMFDNNSIVSFVCQVRKQASEEAGASDASPYERLNLAQLKHVHMLMSRDLSAAVEGADASTVELLRKKCFIAQPVQLNTASKTGLTVIRVALGAPMVSFMYEQERKMGDSSDKSLQHAVGAALENDKLLFNKMQAVLGNWDVLKNFK